MAEHTTLSITPSSITHDSEARQAGRTQAVVLIAATVLPIMGIVSLAPVLPMLLKEFADTPHAEFLVPAALTVPALCIALLSGPFGVVADRFGRHRLLVAGLLLYAFFGVMPLGLDTLNAIVASRVGLGVAEAIIMTATTTLVGDYFGGKDRQKWIAFQAAMGSLAASALFAIGGGLGQLGWRAPFVLYLLALPVAWAAWVWLWEPGRSAGIRTSALARDEETFPRRAFAGVCLFTIFAALAFYVTPIHLGRVLSEIGVSEPARIGLATGLGSLGVPLGAVFFRKFAGAPLHRLLTAAMLLIGVPLVGLYWANSFGQVLALFFVNQIGCGLLLPVVIGWCLSHLPFSWRGRGSGMWNSTFFVSQFFTPIAFTLAVRNTGSVHSAMLVFGVGALIVALVVAAIRVQWGRMGEDTLPNRNEQQAASNH